MATVFCDYFQLITEFLDISKYKTKNKLLSVIFLVAAVGFFVVAGEEISWGQRIFGFKTPENYAKMNTQHELTLHNYGPIFGKVYMVYMYFGLVASTLWIVKPYLIKLSHKVLKPVLFVTIPGWQYFIYFFTAFAHNYDRFFIHIRVNDVLWEEPMELLLFSGIAIFLFEIYLKQLNIFKNR